MLSSFGSYVSRFIRAVPNTNIFNGQTRQLAAANIPKITFAQMNEEIKKSNVTLIDVRDAEELKTDGKIPTSKLIPLQQVANALQMNDSDFKEKYGFDKPKPSDDIRCHCKKGIRAMNAAKIFDAAGYTNVKVYSGTNDWKENGGKFE